MTPYSGLAKRLRRPAPPRQAPLPGGQSPGSLPRWLPALCRRRGRPKFGGHVRYAERLLSRTLASLERPQPRPVLLLSVLALPPDPGQRLLLLGQTLRLAQGVRPRPGALRPVAHGGIHARVVGHGGIEAPGVERSHPRPGLG